MSDPSEVLPPNPYSRVQFVVADATGKISHSGDVPVFMYAAQPVPDDGGTMVVGTADLNTDYVLNGAIAARPANPTTQNGTTLSDVPAGSAITIEGETHPEPVMDGVVELSFAESGAHTVTVACWPYLDAVFTVTT